MKNPFKTLKGTMIFSLIFMLIIPLIIVSVIISGTIVMGLSDTLKEENDVITREISIYAESYFYKHEELLSTISSYYIENPNFQTESALESISKIYKTVELVLILDLDGKVRFTSDQNRTKIGFDMSRQPFFDGAMNTHGYFWSLPFIDPATGETTVTISEKFDDFIIAGYVVVKDFTDFLKALEYDIASIAIVDNSGNIIAHSDPARAIRRENINDNNYYNKDGPGSETHEIYSEDEFISFFSISHTGWFTVISIDASAIREPVNNSYMILFLSTFVIGIIGIAVGIYIANRINNSIKRLSNRTGEVAMGNYSKVIQKTEYEEFNKLIENFNMMTVSIKDREEKLLENNEEMKRVNKELEAFSYSVSHDLRAPLRYVVGFSEALKEDCSDNLDELGKGYIKKICDSAKDMGLLINDILKLSRVTREELNKKKINLSKMVNSIFDYFQRENPERNVKVKVQNDVFAYADENLIYLALENLIGNSWKFTGKEEKGEIEFGVKKENGQRVFYIRDNGAGFDSEYAHMIFEPFQRLHKSTEFEGTGIGTSLVKRVISRHGGKIWAEGQIGKGAAFYFTLKEGSENNG